MQSLSLAFDPRATPGPCWIFQCSRGEGDTSGDCGLCWVKDHGQTSIGEVWVDMKDTVIICVIVYKSYFKNNNNNKKQTNQSGCSGRLIFHNQYTDQNNF